MKNTLVRSAIGWLDNRRAHGYAPSSGVELPPVRLRAGGPLFQDNATYIRSAVADVDRLVSLAGLEAHSRLLDFGCGAGRLGIGIVERLGRIGLYHGVDVQGGLIRWASNHIGRRDGFEFTSVDNENSRYNPTGEVRGSIPVTSSTFDVAYCYSVFSHMRRQDAHLYLEELVRVLRPGGHAFLTAFVEDGVPDDVENPRDYGGVVWQGDLHCVRFNRDSFEELLGDVGLCITRFEHGQETNGQSLYVASCRKEGMTRDDGHPGSR